MTSEGDESGELRENYDELELVLQNAQVQPGAPGVLAGPGAEHPTRIESMNSDDHIAIIQANKVIQQRQTQANTGRREPVLTVAYLNGLFGTQEDPFFISSQPQYHRRKTNEDDEDDDEEESNAMRESSVVQSSEYAKGIIVSGSY